MTRGPFDPERDCIGIKQKQGKGVACNGCSGSFGDLITLGFILMIILLRMERVLHEMDAPTMYVRIGSLPMYHVGWVGGQKEMAAADTQSRRDGSHRHYDTEVL